MTDSFPESLSVCHCDRFACGIYEMRAKGLNYLQQGLIAKVSAGKTKILSARCFVENCECTTTPSHLGSPEPFRFSPVCRRRISGL